MDYKGIFDQEYFNETHSASKKRIYLVRVVHRETKEVVWTGTVEATSCKNAQKQWRKEYSAVRNQYDHSYCLVISST